MGFSGELEQIVSDWQAVIFLRFDDLGSFSYPCKKTLTSEIFGIWPQYFYTVTIHTFITQSFMNSEGLLHCTQTSFNLFSWSNTLSRVERVCTTKAGWLTYFFVLSFLRSLWHRCLWSVDAVCNLEETQASVWLCSCGDLVLGRFWVGRNCVIGRSQNCLVIGRCDQICPSCTPLSLPSLSILLMLFPFSDPHISLNARATSYVVTVILPLPFWPLESPFSKSLFLSEP